MSMAYICDKCGRIIERAGVREIWTVNPEVFSNTYSSMSGEFCFHLCGECYEEFEREYMENKREHGCEAVS